MTRTRIQLGRLERVALFCLFVLVTGGVIGLYAWVQGLHATEPVQSLAAAPATRPAAVKPLPIKPVPLVAEVRMPDATELLAATTRLATMDEPPVVAAMPEPVFPTQVLSTAKVPAGVKPYAIPLISATVVAAAGDASEELPYRYHVKLDPAEVELFRAMIARVGKQDGLQVNEFSQLTGEPAASDLPWWQPGKLADVSVVAVAPKTDKQAKLWTAVSGKTGDALVYSVKPIDFTRHAEARSSD